MDSRHWWRRSYDRPGTLSDSREPSELAVELNRTLERSARILDLGCGPGYDSAYLAQSGHHVVAADFVRVEPNWRAAARTEPNLLFLICDLRDDLPLKSSTIDAVYARLSLHYFSDAATNRIFGEVHRVLTPDGVFVFLCKSTSDPLYGRGEALETNMFRINDKVYHFFDEAFVMTCLGGRFDVEELWSGPQETYGEHSHVMRVRARRRERYPTSHDKHEDRSPPPD